MPGQEAQGGSHPRGADTRPECPQLWACAVSLGVTSRHTHARVLLKSRLGRSLGGKTTEPEARRPYGQRLAQRVPGGGDVGPERSEPRVLPQAHRCRRLTF